VWPFSEGHDDIGSHALYAMKYNSLDAAKALHEAVLPGGRMTSTIGQRGRRVLILRKLTKGAMVAGGMETAT
jgi:hypothetical protein